MKKKTKRLIERDEQIYQLTTLVAGRFSLQEVLDRLAEAAVKIVKREALGPFFTAMPAWNPGQLQQLLTRFQTYYNCHRLHGGLGWQTPAQRWFTKGDEPPKGLDNLFFFNEPELQFAFC